MEREFVYNIAGGVAVKNPLLGVFAVVAVSLLAPGEAFAHHSMSMYDRDQVVTMKATITNFDWTNPHLQIAFETKDDKGNVERWVAEGPGPNRLANRGWSKESLKPGDQVIIYGNPNKNGSATMRFVKIVFADGHELETGFARH
jgi:hypothetical protein